MVVSEEVIEFFADLGTFCHRSVTFLYFFGEFSDRPFDASSFLDGGVTSCKVADCRADLCNLAHKGLVITSLGFLRFVLQGFDFVL